MKRIYRLGLLTAFAVLLASGSALATDREQAIEAWTRFLSQAGGGHGRVEDDDFGDRRDMAISVVTYLESKLGMVLTPESSWQDPGPAISTPIRECFNEKELHVKKNCLHVLADKSMQEKYGISRETPSGGAVSVNGSGTGKPDTAAK